MMILNLRLIDILKYMDEYSYIVVWTEDDIDSEPSYEGIAKNVPWYLAMRAIVKGLDDDTEGIRVNMVDTKSGKDAGMVVSVAGEENDDE